MDTEVPEIISRKDAQARGLKRYFTGKPCLRGHVSIRRVGNKSCIECSVIHDRETKERNVEVLRERARAYYWSDPEHHREVRRARGKRERGKENERNKTWLAKNPDKAQEYNRRNYAKRRDAIAAYSKEWRKENRHHANALGAKRYARLRSSVPSVREDLLPFFQAEILAIYAEARALSELTGERHDVDHIFPISKGGVHAPWNLQILLRVENQRKKAKWPKDQPVHVLWHGELMSRITNTKEFDR